MKIKEKLGPLSELILPIPELENPCVICNEPFKMGQYWTIFDRTEEKVPLSPMSYRAYKLSLAHWECFKRRFRSIDAEWQI